jgi:hypothetical protein
MTAFFDYPKSAAFGRVLPKNKIYEHAKASSKLKNLFVRQVDQIVWKYKLAPETINLPAKKSVPEIQIFNITLKTGELHEDVLRSIDKAIPFPLIFELHHNGKQKAIAAFKRPSDADASKWVTSDYFGTNWQPEDTARISLPVTLDLGALYSTLLSTLMPHKGDKGEDIEARVHRLDLIRAKERELDKTASQLRKEKQFNRKVGINAQIRTLKQEIEQLTRPQATGEQ